MIKILIVDDHAAIRDSFRSALEEYDDMIVVGSISDAKLAPIFFREKRPDLVLMDICTAEGASGLEATELIKKELEGIKVVVMTGYDEVTYMPRARKSGADAFVEKSQTMPFFVQVIRDVIEGKQYFPQQKTIPVQPGEAPLTERELETLRLICEGVSRKEIAERMGISENTLYRHIQSVTGKMGFERTSELVAHVILNGWINPRY